MGVVHDKREGQGAGEEVGVIQLSLINIRQQR